MVVEVIAFVFSALVMVWAFRSASYAFSGGQHAGHHEVADPLEEETMPTTDDLEARYRRQHRFNQAVLYLAGLGVVGAIVGLLVGAWLA